MNTEVSTIILSDQEYQHALQVEIDTLNSLNRELNRVIAELVVKNEALEEEVEQLKTILS